MVDVPSTTASILIGEIQFSQQQIDEFCQLVGDQNPLHRKGVVPFALALGALTGRVFAWAADQDKLNRAVVIVVNTTLEHRLKPGVSYQCYISDWKTAPDQKSGVVRCTIRQDMINQLVLTSTLTVMYR